MEAASPRLPTAIYTAEQVRGLDRIAIEEFGIQLYADVPPRGSRGRRVAQKMARAQSLAIYAARAQRGRRLRSWRCPAGPGLQARSLRSPPDRLSRRRGARLDDYRAWEDRRAVRRETACDEDAVDALLGNGLDRDVGGTFRAVSVMNAAAGGDVAGYSHRLHTDTGLPMAAALRGLTVTFVGLKLGLSSARAPNYRGRWNSAGLGILLPPSEWSPDERRRVPRRGPFCRLVRGPRTRGTQGICCWWAAVRGCPVRFAWLRRRRFGQAPGWCAWRPIPIRWVP